MKLSENYKRSIKAINSRIARRTKGYTPEQRQDYIETQLQKYSGYKSDKINYTKGGYISYAKTKFTDFLNDVNNVYINAITSAFPLKKDMSKQLDVNDVYRDIVNNKQIPSDEELINVIDQLVQMLIVDYYEYIAMVDINSKEFKDAIAKAKETGLKSGYDINYEKLFDAIADVGREYRLADGDYTELLKVIKDYDIIRYSMPKPNQLG